MTQVIVITSCLLAAGVVMDSLLSSGIITQEAAAVVGRPLTPLSGAGVARRTSRRVVRRSGVYAPTLPAGCTTVVIEGASLSQCGSTYYEPYNGQYVQVYVD
jgi:hypothetical protein